MNGCEINLAISALACEIVKGKNDNEIELLSTFFTQLGDTLATILAGNTCCRANESSNQDTKLTTKNDESAG